MNKKMELEPEEYMEWLYQHIKEYDIPEDSRSHEADFCSSIIHKNVYFSQAAAEYEYFSTHTIDNPVRYSWLPDKTDAQRIRPRSISGYFVKIGNQLVPLGFLQEKEIFQDELENCLKQWVKEAEEAIKKVSSSIGKWEAERSAECEFLRAEGKKYCRSLAASILAVWGAAFAAMSARPYWEKVNWYAVFQMKQSEKIPWSVAATWYYGRFKWVNQTSVAIALCILAALFIIIKNVKTICKSEKIVSLYFSQRARDQRRMYCEKAVDDINTLTWEKFCQHFTAYSDGNWQDSFEQVCKETEKHLDEKERKSGGSFASWLYLLCAVLDVAIVRYLCVNIISLWR